jgi:hypothetical protein
MNITAPWLNTHPWKEKKKDGVKRDSIPGLAVTRPGGSPIHYLMVIANENLNI